MNLQPQSPAILLVDDDVEVLKALTKVLEKDGHEVIAHHDAPGAIDFINTAKKKIGLVITDVSMPLMRGTVFLALLKRTLPGVPVIMVTAFGDWGQYMEAMGEGVFEYLSKPLDKTEFLDVVHRALGCAPTLASPGGPDNTPSPGH